MQVVKPIDIFGVDAAVSGKAVILRCRSCGIHHDVVIYRGSEPIGRRIAVVGDVLVKAGASWDCVAVDEKVVVPRNQGDFVLTRSHVGKNIVIFVSSTSSSRA